MTSTLDARLDALRTLLDSGNGRIDDETAAGLDALLGRASARRSLSPEFTVVGVFGATGSGKSSLVNALVGADVARTHVRRPTTSQALSVGWNADTAAELLDWLGVRERVVRQDPIDPRAQKLLLLDLPDFDSIELANRDVAQRLAAQVDALVWVVDPQKYADEVLHVQFIAPHARHGAVTLVVLNQVDLLPESQVDGVMDSLRGILANDGLGRAKVLPVSARTGVGIPQLRAAIGDLAAAGELRDARLAADVSTLAAAIPGPGVLPRRTDVPLDRLSRELADAAGVPVVASAVAGSYRKRSQQATGWPVVSWLVRFRVDPLRRLGLGPLARGSGTGSDPALHRTSMPALSAGGRAAVSMSVRGFADATGQGLAESWRAGIRSVADGTIASLPDELDLAIARTRLPAKGSWWWAIFAVVQWVALLAALVGAGWLLANALLPGVGLPRFEVPTVEGWAVPTLLIVAGVLLGILLGVLGTVIGRAVSASRRRRARRVLTASVREVTRRVVVGPIVAELDRAREFAIALAVARD